MAKRLFFDGLAVVAVIGIIAFLAPQKPDQLASNTDTPSVNTPVSDAPGSAVAGVLGTNTAATPPPEAPASPARVTRQARIRAAAPVLSVPVPIPVQTTAQIPPSDVPVPECDENYVPCVPISEPGEIDCDDIASVVTIKGEDIHTLDDDGNGTACEEFETDPSEEVTPPIDLPKPTPTT